MTTEALPRCECFPLGDPGAEALLARPGARVLHFFRHGEALHQRRNAEARTRGEHCRCFDPPSARGRGYVCPYTSEDLVDSPLTLLGREQSAGGGLDLEVGVVLSSPMRRTLESAVLAFPAAVPILALPALRPRIGDHRHSKRSPREVLERLFPSVDLTRVPYGEDRRWSEATELREDLERRAGRFLDFALARPERELAVVTHFTLLLALLLPADETFTLGPSQRPEGSPALLDCSGCADPAGVREPVPVGGTRSLVVARRASP